MLTGEVKLRRAGCGRSVSRQVVRRDLRCWRADRLPGVSGGSIDEQVKTDPWPPHRNRAIRALRWKPAVARQHTGPMAAFRTTPSPPLYHGWKSTACLLLGHGLKLQRNREAQEIFRRRGHSRRHRPAVAGGGRPRRSRYIGLLFAVASRALRASGMLLGSAGRVSSQPPRRYAKLQAGRGIRQHRLPSGRRARGEGNLSSTYYPLLDFLRDR